MTAATPGAAVWALLRTASDRLSVYVPIILMGLMALGTYWLARNTPSLGDAERARTEVHEPDYLMRRFSLKTFDPSGRIKSEIVGSEARHYPDTDTIEIDQPRIRAFNLRGELTAASARRAISNADGTEVQLIGDAVVTREAVKGQDGQTRPRLQFRGEFLHAFLDSERVVSHKPVELTHGNNRFTAEGMEYDNVEQVMDLRGRVRGTLVSRSLQ